MKLMWEILVTSSGCLPVPSIASKGLMKAIPCSRYRSAILKKMTTIVLKMIAEGYEPFRFVCMIKKSVKKSVKKKATSVKKAVRKTAVKKAKDIFYSWRESKKETVGLVQREGVAYAAMKKGRAWTYSKEPVIKARGQDFDPNRPKFFFDHHGIDVLGVFDIPEGALVVYQSARREA